MPQSNHRNDPSPPDVIENPLKKIIYEKGKFLGKGGFAKCYELTDRKTREVYAGKIVPKSLLVKEHQRDKMSQEIAIHKNLSHPHIVKFYDNFEDDQFVYITLELCRRRSLMELHRRRRVVTDMEAKYFLKQIVEAVDYLHKHNVIHRDLKLGNLFLNEDLGIKIGDFGLATKLDNVNEIRRTLCGTPNYIAPEVLRKSGHTFSVDAWSIGCIVYTLLLGKPPFETTSLRDTYSKIKNNEYHLPSGKISPEASSLIRRLLHADPGKRPKMTDILVDPYLQGYIPSRLPTSCLTMAPRFDANQSFVAAANRASLKPIDNLCSGDDGFVAGSKPKQALAAGRGDILPSKQAAEAGKQMEQDEDPAATPSDYYLRHLTEQVLRVVTKQPSSRQNVDDDAEYPAAVPVYWISKWVDYSDKYGLGYQLNDNSVGVLFNDQTRLLLQANGENMEYIQRDGAEQFFMVRDFPPDLNKKVTLIKYFKNYMQEHLLKAGSNIHPRECDDLGRLPYLRMWFRTRSAICLHLNNGTLQINFFSDHTKLILCPLMGAVTYINEDRVFRVFLLNSLAENGCSSELHQRLCYARQILEKLQNTRSSSARTGRVGSSAAENQDVPAVSAR